MRPVTAASLGLVAGMALALVIGRGSIGPGSEDGAVVAVLEAELDRERAIGEALRDRVEDLEARAARASGASGSASEFEPLSDASATTIADTGGAVAAAAGEQGSGDASEAAAASPPGGFEDAKLLALGFHESDVERLRRAWESLELERLFLQNERARSPGGDGQHWLKMRELENATLEELGESEYDALLYASGNRNRITVTRVFPESPAEAAGFAEGDQIIAYGERPLFRMHALKGETTRCELDTTVSVSVLRDGGERRVWAPCGPLGVQLEMVNAPPR